MVVGKNLFYNGAAAVYLWRQVCMLVRLGYENAVPMFRYYPDVVYLEYI